MQILTEHFKRPSVPASPAQWLEMSAAEVSGLALRLASEESASIKQYPSFNERFRRLFSKPVCLKCIDETGQARGCICLISIRVAGVRCGAVIDGPVMFGGSDCSADQAQALTAWLRSRGYAFVRFTHRDRARLGSLAALRGTVSENPLPFLPRYGGECVIDLKNEDGELLAGFQKTARKKIRAARQAGCLVKRSSDVKDLREVWPGFVKQSGGKGFRYRSLDRYEAMYALSPRGDLLRLYTGCYGDRTAFQLVVLRERTEAYGLIAALNREALEAKPSPSCLVHWTAMCDYRELGCSRYNMGQPTGSVYQYKRQFHPLLTPSPSTVTVVLRPSLYRIWVRFFIPSTSAVLRWPTLFKSCLK